MWGKYLNTTTDLASTIGKTSCSYNLYVVLAHALLAIPRNCWKDDVLADSASGSDSLGLLEISRPTVTESPFPSAKLISLWSYLCRLCTTSLGNVSLLLLTLWNRKASSRLTISAVDCLCVPSLARTFLLSCWKLDLPRYSHYWLSLSLFLHYPSTSSYNLELSLQRPRL